MKEWNVSFFIIILMILAFDTIFFFWKIWNCRVAATEEEVKERAAQWDQPVTEYIELAERYLGFQQSGSVYRFADAGDDHKRVSFSSSSNLLDWEVELCFSARKFEYWGFRRE